MQLEKLTEETFQQHGNRKKEGRLSLIVDTDAFEAYAVPKNIEHIDFLREHFGKEDSKYVPAHLDFNSYKDIQAVIIGESGVEQGYGVRHTEEQLTKARQKVLELIVNSPFQTSRDCDYKEAYEYVTFK